MFKNDAFEFAENLNRLTKTEYLNNLTSFNISNNNGNESSPSERTLGGESTNDTNTQTNPSRYHVYSANLLSSSSSNSIHLKVSNARRAKQLRDMHYAQYGFALDKNNRHLGLVRRRLGRGGRVLMDRFDHTLVDLLAPPPPASNNNTDNKDQSANHHSLISAEQQLFTFDAYAKFKTYYPVESYEESSLTALVEANVNNSANHFVQQQQQQQQQHAVVPDGELLLLPPPPPPPPLLVSASTSSDSISSKKVLKLKKRPTVSSFDSLDILLTDDEENDSEDDDEADHSEKSNHHRVPPLAPAEPVFNHRLFAVHQQLAGQSFTNHQRSPSNTENLNSPQMSDEDAANDKEVEDVLANLLGVTLLNDQNERTTLSSEEEATGNSFRLTRQAIRLDLKAGCVNTPFAERSRTHRDETRLTASNLRFALTALQPLPPQPSETTVVASSSTSSQPKVESAGQLVNKTDHDFDDDDEKMDVTTTTGVDANQNVGLEAELPVILINSSEQQADSKSVLSSSTAPLSTEVATAGPVVITTPVSKLAAPKTVMGNNGQVNLLAHLNAIIASDQANAKRSLLYQPPIYQSNSSSGSSVVTPVKTNLFAINSATSTSSLPSSSTVSSSSSSPLSNVSSLTSLVAGSSSSSSSNNNNNNNNNNTISLAPAAASNPANSITTNNSNVSSGSGIGLPIVMKSQLITGLNSGGSSNASNAVVVSGGGSGVQLTNGPASLITSPAIINGILSKSN
jgi:hypothetical protein